MSKSYNIETSIINVEELSPDEILQKIKYVGNPRISFIDINNLYIWKNFIDAKPTFLHSIYYYTILAQDHAALKLLLEYYKKPLGEIFDYRTILKIIPESPSQEFINFIKDQLTIFHKGKYLSFNEAKKLKILTQSKNSKSNLEASERLNNLEKLFPKNLCKAISPIVKGLYSDQSNKQLITKYFQESLQEFTNYINEQKDNLNTITYTFFLKNLSNIFYTEQNIDLYKTLFTHKFFQKLSFQDQCNFLNNAIISATNANYSDHALYIAKYTYDLLKLEKINNQVDTNLEFIILYNLATALTPYDPCQALTYCLQAQQINPDDADNNHNIILITKIINNGFFKTHDDINVNNKPIEKDYLKNIEDETNQLKRDIIKISIRKENPINGDSKLFYSKLFAYLINIHALEKLNDPQVLKFYVDRIEIYNNKQQIANHGVLNLTYFEFYLFMSHNKYDEALIRLKIINQNQSMFCHKLQTIIANEFYIGSLVINEKYDEALDFLENNKFINDKHFIFTNELLIKALQNKTLKDTTEISEVKDSPAENDDSFTALVDILPSHKLAEFINSQEQKKIHEYYQNLRAKKFLNNISKNIDTESKSIKLVTDDNQNYTFNKENKFNHNNKTYYAIIDSKLKLDPKLLEQFNQALAKGITYVKFAQNGIKIINNSLIELKINHSDSRLYTDTIYKSKQTGEYFIIFNEIANHKEIKIKAKNKGTLKTELVDTEIICVNESDQENDNPHDHIADFSHETTDVVSDLPNIDDAKLLGDEA